MEYLSPFEAEWSMAQNRRKMQQLVDQTSLASTVQDHRRARRSWHKVLSFLQIPRAGLRHLEPVKDQQ